MQTITTDQTEGVALSDGLSVCHDREPCENGWTDWDAVWGGDSIGPNKVCIGWDPCPVTQRVILRGKIGAHCEVYGLSVVSCKNRLYWSRCSLGCPVRWVQWTMY